MKKRNYNKKPTARNGASDQTDIADALRSDPALSAFTFDGPLTRKV
ncbi:hypothetical protein ACFFJN_04895 [Erwinia mallotivora]